METFLRGDKIQKGSIGYDALSDDAKVLIGTNGDSIFEKGDAENSAILKGEYEGYSNKAISQTSIAVGAATTAGLKGWYYSKIEFGSTPIITLSDKQPSVFLGYLSGGEWTSGTPNIKVGDKISIVNNSKYDYCGEVKSISSNKVTLKSALPFDKLDTGLISLNNPDDWSIYLPDNESAGIIDFGGGALAEGVNTKSTNIGSHAEGIQTHAYGQYSHTEGRETKAGYAAHAEGRNTKAMGEQSHSEGTETQALGNNSHAEGKETKATNYSSHAEGYGTVAGDKTTPVIINDSPSNGCYSHAEGNGTRASGHSSHSEGKGSNSTGNMSHAEGLSTESIGNASHAEGNKTKTFGSSSHSEGITTTAGGAGSHAEGTNTKTGIYDSTTEQWTNGNSAHAEGYCTTASASYSHAEGNVTNAIGESSHAEGIGTIAGGAGSHAEGTNTKTGIYDSTTEQWTNGYYAHAEGFCTTASASYSHAEGEGTTASGIGSHAEGKNTTAGGRQSHAQGENSHADGNISFASGRNTYASSSMSSAFGDGTIANNVSSTAFGSYNVSIAKTNTNTNADATFFSIGIGRKNTDDDAATNPDKYRKNAFEVKANGDIYIEGVEGRIQDRLNTSTTSTPDWNAQEGEAGYIENRTHYFEKTLLVEQCDVGSVTDDIENLPIAFRFSDGYAEENPESWPFVNLRIVDNTNSEEFDFKINLVNPGEQIFDFGYIYVHEYDGHDIKIAIAYLMGDPVDLYEIKYNTINENYLPDTVIKTTPQELSDNEKNQVKENLGISTSTPNWDAQKGEPGYIENKPFYFNEHYFTLLNFIQSDDQMLYTISDSDVMNDFNKLLVKYLYNYETNLYGAAPKQYEYKFIDFYTPCEGILLTENDDVYIRYVSDGNGNITFTYYTQYSSYIELYYYTDMSYTYRLLNESFIPDTIARKTDIPTGIVKTTPQTLSDADKNQALTNLGIDNTKYILSVAPDNKFNIREFIDKFGFIAALNDDGYGNYEGYLTITNKELFLDNVLCCGFNTSLAKCIYVNDNAEVVFFFEEGLAKGGVRVSFAENNIDSTPLYISWEPFQ